VLRTYTHQPGVQLYTGTSSTTRERADGAVSLGSPALAAVVEPVYSRADIAEPPQT
jgi:hypothetical protein